MKLTCVCHGKAAPRVHHIHLWYQFRDILMSRKRKSKNLIFVRPGGEQSSCHQKPKETLILRSPHCFKRDDCAYSVPLCSYWMRIKEVHVKFTSNEEKAKWLYISWFLKYLPILITPGNPVPTQKPAKLVRRKAKLRCIFPFALATPRQPNSNQIIWRASVSFHTMCP